MNKEQATLAGTDLFDEVYNECDGDFEKTNKRLMQAILYIDEIVCDAEFTRKLIKKLEKNTGRMHLNGL